MDDPIRAAQRRMVTVTMLRAQMVFAAQHGMLVAYSKKDPKAKGADWPDPTLFAPPEFGPTRY
jgi:hypothetical protein